MKSEMKTGSSAGKAAETTTVKILIAGIAGRMGRASAQLITHAEGVSLVGAFGRSDGNYVGKDVSELLPRSTGAALGILVRKDMENALGADKPDVLLDFTHAEVAVENAKKALELGIRPVIGTSGISAAHVEELRTIASKKKVGALVIPNFSIGAVLMMEFARQAGSMFEHVEVVEMHHTGKKDAPSGTAMHTVAKLASASQQYNKSEVEETELLKGSRGGLGSAGVRVHSLRLPGLISHQEVIFGGEGELLTIRHDSFNTDCFLKGILLSLKAVMQLDHLLVGLDSILPINGSRII